MTRPSMQSGIVSDLLLTLGARGASIAIGVLTASVVARCLGAEGKGILTIAMLVSTFMQWLGPLGLNTANVYFMGTHPETTPRLIGNTLRVSLAVSTLYVALFWLLYPAARGFFFQGIPPLCLAIASVSGAMQIYQVNAASILLGQRRYGQYNEVNLLQAALTLLFLFIMLVVFKMGVAAALAAMALATSLAVGRAAFHVLRGTKGIPPGDGQLLWIALRYGFITFLSGVSYILLLRVDFFLVDAWRPSRAEVGFYSIAVTISEVIKTLPDVLHLTLFPRLSSEGRTGGAMLAAAVARISMAAIAPAIGGLMFLSRWIIVLAFGREFLPALQPSWILLASVIFLVLSHNVGTYLMGNGLVWQQLSGPAAGLVAMLVLDWRWIPRYGIAGAAWGSLAGYAIMALVHLWFFRRHSGVGIGAVLIPQSSDLRHLRIRLGGSGSDKGAGPPAP